MPDDLTSPRDLHRPVIQAKVLGGILNAVDLTRRQQADLLKAEGLGPADLRGVSATIPLLSYLRIFERLSRAVGAPMLGLDISAHMGPELVGAIGYIFIHSANLDAGIRAFTQSVFSIQDVTHLSYETGSSPMLVYTITDETMQPRRQDVEFSLGFVHTLIKAYLGGRFTPREVYFEHARPARQRTAHELFFGCPVFFEQDRNALVLHKEDMRRGSARSDPSLVALLQHYIQLVGHRDYAVTTLTESINQVLSSAVAGEADISRVAARLGLSEASLRRRLKREGASFRDLARNKRISMAKRHLFETDMNVLQIAQKVGYSETASFSRAFVRETGQTPTQFRHHSRKWG